MGMGLKFNSILTNKLTLIFGHEKLPLPHSTTYVVDDFFLKTWLTLIEIMIRIQ